MSEEEQDKRIEGLIEAKVKGYWERLETFEAGKRLVTRWIERVPEFKDFVRFSEAPHRNIDIWAINLPDGESPPDREWEEQETTMFQLWFQEKETVFYIMYGVEQDDGYKSSGEWLRELEVAIADRIGWLRREVKAEE